MTSVACLKMKLSNMQKKKNTISLLILEDAMEIKPSLFHVSFSNMEPLVNIKTSNIRNSVVLLALSYFVN